MKLNSNDYREMAQMIEEPGTDTLTFEKDGEVLEVKYSLDVDGYVEDDYYNGTGAYVATCVDFAAEVVDCYTEDGEDAENDFNAKELEKELNY